MRKYIIIICILLFTDYSFSQSVKYIEEFPDKGSTRNADIYALVDGKKIPILADEKDAKRVLRQEDFNSDGYMDVLITTGLTGDECCDAGYIIVFYDGERFHESQKIEWFWGDYCGIDTNKKGHYRFTIGEQGYKFLSKDLDPDIVCNLATRIFGIEGYNFVLLETIKGSLISAVKEKRVTEFKKEGVNEHIKQTLYYDIDRDGKEDRLIVSYKKNSPNHSGVVGSIILGNGKVFEIPGIDIRIGILKSVTNGMHDLVIGCDEILKWNGETYTQD